MEISEDNVFNALDSIHKIDFGGVTYFSVTDLSEIFDNPRPYNLIRCISRKSVLSQKNGGRKGLFIDSLGLLSIFIKNKEKSVSNLSSEVLKYLSSNMMFVSGGKLSTVDDAPLEVVENGCSRRSTELYDKKTLPIPRKYLEIYGKWIVIYKTETRYPIFNLANLSKAFSIDPKKSVKKIREDRREKLIKMSRSNGDRFSWFIGPIGAVELITRSTSNSVTDKSRELFNLILEILGGV